MAVAVLSVNEKKGIVELGRALHLAGYDLVASQGTAEVLQAADVSDGIAPLISIPDFLRSRGIVGKKFPVSNSEAAMGLLAAYVAGPRCDVEIVVCTFKGPHLALDGSGQLQSDIAGVNLVRAAAAKGLLVATDRRDYHRLAKAADDLVCEINSVHVDELRFEMRLKALKRTARYQRDEFFLLFEDYAKMLSLAAAVA